MDSNDPVSHQPDSQTVEAEASIATTPADSQTPQASEAYILQSGEAIKNNAKKLKAGGPDHLEVADKEQSRFSGQLSKWPSVMIASALGLALIIIVYGYLAPKPVLVGNNQTQTSQKPEPANPIGVMAKAPNTMIAGVTPNLPPEPPIVPSRNQLNTAQNPPNQDLSNSSTSHLANYSQTEPVDYVKQAQIQLQMQQAQEAAQREAARLARLQTAKEAPSTVFSAYDNESHKTGNTSNLNSNPDNTLPVLNTPSSRTGIQAHISTFEGSNYLSHTRQPAISPYEIKAGTVIPSVMMSGVNSDLPGQLVAQVVQNVYDSATGKYLLIPQGAKLVGTYEHNINAGQKRVLIIWNRIIYPDSSSLNLEAMSGQDQSGYAGFKDKTDTHLWPAFRNALLLSAITAGVQLSQPSAQSGNSAYSSQQIIAASLGMQMNQLGLSSYQNQVNMAPTLTIRPGYRFNVMVSKDMVIPPWRQENADQPMMNQTAFQG